MLKVTKNVLELNGIRPITTAGPVVRNDQAVGSIPTSSTKFSIPPLLCFGDLIYSGMSVVREGRGRYSVWDFAGSCRRLPLNSGQTRT
jgi:hypothetical protein